MDATALALRSAFSTRRAGGPAEPRGRPATRLGLAGLAAHVFFELAAGVGMPFASIAGPVPAAGMWTVGTGGLWRAAKTRPASADPVFAAVNGLGLAAIVAHMAGWPRRRTRLGLPWLQDCEGLGPELMRFYNPILYAGGAACLAGLVRENRTAPAGVPLAALALTPVLVAVQHGEFRRLRLAAAIAPGWWNRRLRRTSRD